MPKPSSELAEVVLENVEVIAKQLLDDDSLARDIPFVSSALKVLKASSSISDKILGRKLEKLFGALHQVPEEDRNAMYQRLLGKPAEAARVGELVLLTIDQLNDLEKPLWVAMMLLGYMDGVLTLEELRSLCLVATQTLPTDLENLVSNANRPPSKQQAELSAFVPSGLAFVQTSGTWDDDGVMLYGVTSIGNKLADVHAKWRCVLE